MENIKGLYNKYLIHNADGSPLEPGFKAFVLRLDDGGDPAHVAASRAAALKYSEEMETPLPQLDQGLNRYQIKKADGSELPSEFDAFVLRLDEPGNSKYDAATRAAIFFYANQIAPHLPQLADDIRMTYE